MAVAKNLLLALASFCLFFLLLEGVFAALGLEPALESEDPFVGFAAKIPLYLETEGPRLRVWVHSRRSDGDDLFR